MIDKQHPLLRSPTPRLPFGHSHMHHISLPITLLRYITLICPHPDPSLSPHPPSPRLPSLQDTPICWICLDTGGELIFPCRCPRTAHRKCLARWQLQSAGTRFVVINKNERDHIPPRPPSNPFSSTHLYAHTLQKRTLL